MFQGLSTALTALYADQTALDTTGNNIANANTAGYTRERVDMTPIGLSTSSGFFAVPTNVGAGVSIADIKRLRDEFTATQALAAHGQQGLMQQTSDTLNTVEASFAEPSDTGIQSQLSAFWSSWDDVANNPGDIPARSAAVEQSQTLVAGFQAAASDMTNLSNADVTKLKNDVTQVNTMASTIADLNTQIQAATNSGATPNALFDQRDELINNLSTLVGVTVQPSTAGSVAVQVNGVSLVRDGRVTTLQVSGAASPVSLIWNTGGTNPSDNYVANITGGEVAGLTKAINTAIPKYKAGLDAVAANLISTVNSVHAAGVDLNGNPGQAFFSGTSAADIIVNSNIVNDPSLLAAASSAPGTGSLDGSNALKMANLATSTIGPDNAYQKAIDVLGVDTQQATNQLNIQTNITTAADSSQASESGVSLDDEMTNLIRYQKSYNAAAKYLSTMNDTMDTLIGMIR